MGLLTWMTLLTLASGSGAGERMYVQNNWQFITLDPLSGVVLDVKPLSPLILNRGLVYDDGSLFFLDQNVGIERDRLMELNIASGRTRIVGPTGYSLLQSGALARDPTTGQFYVTFAERIFELDKETGAIQFVTSIKVPSAFVYIDVIAFDSRGVAFGLAGPSGISPRYHVYRVDLETGALTHVGGLDIGLGFFRTIAFDSADELWGLFTPWAAPQDHKLYKINLQSLTLTEPFPLPQGAMGIAFGPAPRVTTYCTAKTNSAGCAPSIEWSGYPSSSASFGFEVTCSKVLNNSIGVFLLGTGGRASTPFQGGILCLGGPWVSSQPVFAGGTPPPASDCSGMWSIDLNTLIYWAFPVSSGSIVNGQWWGRDPGLAPPDSAQLSDALEVVVMP